MDAEEKGAVSSCMETQQSASKLKTLALFPKNHADGFSVVLESTHTLHQY